MTRRARVLALPLAVVTTWVGTVTVLGHWGRVSAGWQAAATMVAGSVVAGATPQGGGAVAFPVFTKALGVPADAARTFSLCIQAVGMGTAAVTIVAARRRVAWSAIGAALPAALVGFTAMLLAAEVAPPPADAVRVGFTVVVGTTAAALVVAARRSPGSALDVDATGPNVVVLAAVGGLGGALAALVGSGADVAVYLLAVVVLGVRPAVGVPTSVVVMAVVSLAGLIQLGWIRGGLATAPGADVDLFALWLAAVPVVAVGAPLGSWLASIVTERQLIGAIAALAAVEVVSTIVLVDSLPPVPVATAMVVVPIAVGTAAVLRCRRPVAVPTRPVRPARPFTEATT